MRVIKFRAWDSENRQMLDVQELNFEDCFYGGGMQIKTTMYNDYFDYREMPLMQYTGLKDKNGKEIYEGDVVKIIISCKGDYITAEIKYSEEYTQYIIVNTNNITHEAEGLGDYHIENLEVIGNIYDNPKLLKVSD